MKNHHKYFVNRRYRNRLVVKSRENRPFTCIAFYTDVPDTTEARKIRRWGVHDYDKSRGKYRYYHKPDVAYTVREEHPDISTRTRFYKKVANRKVRHYRGEIANGGAYKKLFEYWWVVD